VVGIHGVWATGDCGAGSPSVNNFRVPGKLSKSAVADCLPSPSPCAQWLCDGCPAWIQSRTARSRRCREALKCFQIVHES
jgi:hypothetical protein